MMKVMFSPARDSVAVLMHLHSVKCVNSFSSEEDMNFRSTV